MKGMSKRLVHKLNLRNNETHIKTKNAGNSIATEKATSLLA